MPWIQYPRISDNPEDTFTLTLRVKLLSKFSDIRVGHAAFPAKTAYLISTSVPALHA